MNALALDSAQLVLLLRQALEQQSSPLQTNSSLPPSSLDSSLSSSEPPIDPSLLGPPSPHAVLLEEIGALKNRVSQLEESCNFADDEGDGCEGARRDRSKHLIIGGECKRLSVEQKNARMELMMAIRQVMKTLTDRGEEPEEPERAPEERGFIPDYNKPARHFENAEMISRTMELVLADYKTDEATGHFLCGEVPFNKADLRQLATTAFTNKKRHYLTQQDATLKKKDKRHKRRNRRHLRKRQTKKQREAQKKAYKEKYGADLPAEIFQTDCMTELLSELDSTDVPDAPSDGHTEGDLYAEEEDEDEQSKRENIVKTAQAVRAAQLAAASGLTAREKEERVKVWEERRPSFRSAKLNRVYKRLDKLTNEEREKTAQTSRFSSRRVFIGNTYSKMPKCKKLVWPFMVDRAWLEDDEDQKKSRWTKLQRSDPEQLDLGFLSGVDTPDSDAPGS